MRWCFDQAIITFGTSTEYLLSQRDRRGKPVHTLKALLAEPTQRGEVRKITRAELMAMGIPVEIPISE